MVEPVLLVTVTSKSPPAAFVLNTISSVLPISVVELSANNAVVLLALTLIVPVRWFDRSVV